MGYYDGNTVTAMWNYAQHFALNDNSSGLFLDLRLPGLSTSISGQNNGIIATNGLSSSGVISDLHGDQTMIGDTDPLNDVCSSPTTMQTRMRGRNVATC